MKIILASKSPRRREILENLGVEFDIIAPDTDEASDEKEPSRLVASLALAKGEAAAELLMKEPKYIDSDERIIIISSDTLVAVGSEILGKPSDLDGAAEMLRRIQGRSHSVYSGIALTEIRSGRIVKSVAESDVTTVHFAPMSDREIDFYVNTERVLDKAGAYAIQGYASAWIDKIDGDYFNVVGLPVRKLFVMMSRELGINPEDIMRRV